MQVKDDFNHCTSCAHMTKNSVNPLNDSKLFNYALLVEDKYFFKEK